MMIVRCQACQTQFRVDESRIQGRGARMRCRRCGEAIIVMKDSAPRSGPRPAKNLFDLRSVLKQPESKPSRIFGEAPPTPSPQEPGAPAAWERPAEEPPEATVGEEPPGIESPDETISLRMPEEAPRETEAASAQEEPSAPQEPEAPPAWERTEEEPPEATAGEEPPGIESPDERISLRMPEEAPRETEAASAQEEPSAPQEPEAPAAWERTEEEPPEATAWEEPPGIESQAPVNMDITPSSPPGQPALSDEMTRSVAELLAMGKEPPAAEEKPFELLLNDAGSLDFLTEEYKRAETEGELDISGILRSDPSPDPEAAVTAPPIAPREIPREEPMPDRLEAIQRELQEIGGGSPDPVETRSLSPSAVPSVPPVRKPPPISSRVAARPGSIRGGRPSLLPLVILFLLISGGGAYLGFTPGGQEILRRMVPAMESLWLGGESPEARYSVGNLIGYYEPNANAGTLFVIKGTVTNQGRKKRSGIRVHAELLGSGGEHIANKSGFAGNVLSGDGLRSSSKEAIEKGMANRWGDKLANLDIAPGKSIPFMIVFFDAPAGIEEYRLEARDGE